LKIFAVILLGKISPPATLSFHVSNEPLFQLSKLSENTSPKNPPETQNIFSTLPKLGDASIAILDELDKVTENGDLIPKQPKSYFAANHLWDASQNKIHLYAARNEWIGFQIYFNGDVKNVKPIFLWDKSAANAANAYDYYLPSVTFSRFGYIDSKIGKIADPVILLKPEENINITKQNSLLCEIYVPKTAKQGYHGNLVLTEMNGDQAVRSVSIDVYLTVWDFSLPDTLQFFPEMNCYGLPENERDYYRMAQLHRTYINRVPYSHRGTVNDGCAPRWNAKTQTFDWTDWDKRYKDYFDGTAFQDLPRGAVPIEAFYLPLFENFPADIFQHYNGNAWANDAFDNEYRETFQTAARQFAEHFIAKKWNQTCFQFFLNNKMDYKRDGWNRASSPWLLDEPASFQDFAALKFFGEQFQIGVQSLNPRNMPIRFRCDISRPQWQRDSLNGVLDVNVVGGEAFHRYNRLINDRKERFGQIIYTYGTTCPPESGAYQPVIWSLDAWSLGADGIVPWQTIGNADSWKNSDELAIFYPPQNSANNLSTNTKETIPNVIPSLRLKGYRRGQQDVEYLVLLQKAKNLRRWNVAQMVRHEINFQPQTLTKFSEDAGTVHYESVSPQDLWRLRIDVARLIEGL